MGQHRILCFIGVFGMEYPLNLHTPQRLIDVKRHEEVAENSWFFRGSHNYVCLARLKGEATGVFSFSFHWRHVDYVFGVESTEMPLILFSLENGYIRILQRLSERILKVDTLGYREPTTQLLQTQHDLAVL